METNNPVQNKAAKEAKKPKSVWKKGTITFSRWLHIYLSMLSFVVVLFFAVTGLTLNHAEWFDGKQVEKKHKGAVPAAWVKVRDTTQIKKLEIVELLRKNYGIKGYVSDFIIQDDQCSVSFKGPGYSADAFISRKDGKFQLSELRLGVVAVLNDLHKGRDSGTGWSWLIDVSAVFLTLVSLTGLVMLCFLKKKRLNGIILLIIGGAICCLIYWVFVP
ncbi:PepSY-associated TM helix domain-containing protein [uncultured Mucilaginibacter sp.]|uniref:PepSY-associated TM helix domain-containing protein n=1 Tax=uncultured Mucilaginibacter sp. TaxID=797541 RepID=UPI0025DCF591|nr:PepSY-associated TM helix domain-containing protein [uncultured Mucilaginibacter sp.]